MNTLAYINGDITTEKYQELLKKNVTSVLIDVPQQRDDDTIIAKSLEIIINNLSLGDQVIIYDLSNLCRTLFELSNFFKRAKQKGIKLIFLNKEEIFNSMTDDEFIEFIFDLNKENQRVNNERRKRSDNTIKNVGRPKISQENIKKIRYLRLEKKYSLRDTAKLCGVSVATVYKYTDKDAI